MLWRHRPSESHGPGRRALITGATGFVGREVRRALTARGWRTVGISRADGDIRDRGFVGATLSGEGFDLIVHLAGVLRGEERHLMSSNVDGTKALLDSVPGGFKGAIVVASSSAVYGASGADPVDEDAPIAPVTPYGRSKVAEEATALEAGARLGLRVVIARLFNLLGPGLSPQLACGAFVERIVAIEHGADPVIRVGNLSTIRDYVDVRDAAEALVDIGNLGVAGWAYNVASGRGTSTGWCLRFLLGATSASIRVEIDPAFQVTEDVPVQVGDPGRLLAATGWSPTFTVETSLTDMLAVRRMEAK
ncbi:MAG: NAD-dependent epimerase/dehydratase family protein [Chloroflexota bacterium]